MLYPARFLLLTAAFLVPNTKAIISTSPETRGQNAGYHCEAGGKAVKVSIYYTNSPDNLPCKVILERGGNGAIPLLEAKRNASICENKIEVMKQRLVDRGWYCRSYDPKEKT